MSDLNGYSNEIPTTVVHIAGLPMAVKGQWFRQRCAWCDTVLLDVALDQPIGQGGLIGADGQPVAPQGAPNFAPPSVLIRVGMVDGVMATADVLPHEGSLPYDFCGAADTFLQIPDDASSLLESGE